tara:strand:- start:50 stop:352 length:303 start_codon:yes stop_codon:yes gene_type:complete
MRNVLAVVFGFLDVAVSADCSFIEALFYVLYFYFFGGIALGFALAFTFAFALGASALMGALALIGASGFIGGLALLTVGAAGAEPLLPLVNREIKNRAST